MTLMINFGKWGGVYIFFGKVSWRLCLGFVAFTIMFLDIDVPLKAGTLQWENYDKRK